MNKAKRFFIFLTVLLTLLAGVMVGMMIFPVGTPKESEAPMPSPESLPGFSAESEEQQKSDTEKPQEIINPEGKTLQERVAPPPGYERTEARRDSLTTFLRKYPLKKAGKPVLLYNGEEKGNQSAHMAVFKLPMEKEDLQQCADSVMRVYAEYFWKTGQKERISFRFVDGFQAEYTKWRSGYRIRTGESRSSWVPGGAHDDSYENFKSKNGICLCRYAFNGTGVKENKAFRGSHRRYFLVCRKSGARCDGGRCMQIF